MPELEDLIRQTLQDRQAAAPVALDLLAGATARRRRRRTALSAAGVVCATALAILTPLTVISWHRWSPSQATSTPPSPPVHRGTTSGMFTVAPPMLSTVIGPVPVQQPDCTPAQIDATAELRRSTYGVLGVVELHGHRCSIPMDPGPVGLIDRHGRLLNVRLAPFSRQTGHNIRPDLTFAAGAGAWGFAWTGSWCGPAPARVVIALTGQPRSTATATPSLTVPISGATLPCTGTSDSTLVRGAPGRIGESVLPPPAAWSSLTATLHLPAKPPHQNNLAVTLSNHSDTDVALDPCPRYTVAIHYQYRDGETTPTTTGILACDAHRSVPAHGHATFRLPPYSLPSEDTRKPLSMTFEFGIASGITASVKVPVN